MIIVVPGKRVTINRMLTSALAFREGLEILKQDRRTTFEIIIHRLFFASLCLATFYFLFKHKPNEL